MPNIKNYIKKELGKSADTSGNAQEVQHIGVINKQHSRNTQQANGSEQAESSQQAINRQQTIERQHHSNTDRIQQGKDSRFEKFKIGFKKLGRFIPSKRPDFLFYRYERDPTTGENQKIAVQKIKAEKRISHFFNRSYKNKLFAIDPTRLDDNYGNDRIFGGFDPYHLPHQMTDTQTVHATAALLGGEEMEQVHTPSMVASFREEDNTDEDAPESS